MAKTGDEKYLPFFKINNRINILIPKEQKVGSDFVYHTSRIEDIDATGMMLAAPMIRRKQPLVVENEIVYGQMPVEEALYDFDCIYLGETVQGELYFWRVSLPYNIFRKQQRNYVRYDISMPVVIRTVDSGESIDNETVFFKTKDISGGGLKIISKTPFEEGSVFDVSLIIPDYGEILTNARVVRVQKPHEEVKLYWSGFEFLDINSKDRTAIIQFIFKKQLEDRRKFINNL